MRKLLIITMLCINFSAHARWDTLESSTLDMEFYNSYDTVKEDGSYEEIIEKKFKILNEVGRSENSSFIYAYNGNDSEIKVLEAYTIYNWKKYPVDLEKLEDKPLASSAQGFDQQRQIMLPFSKVEIGAELYLKYVERKIETELSKYYYKTIYFAPGCCWQSSHRTITSVLPLYIEVNDPDNVIEVQQTQKDGMHILDLKLKNAICRSTAPGSEEGFLSDRKLPWVHVSTFKTWAEYGKQYEEKYEKVINQKLPQLFTPILNAALHEKDEIAQINFVTSEVNEKINYLGYWGSVKGQFVPRDLDVIASSQNGDCKDFTAVTSAILRELGYKVQPTLVWRGEGEPTIKQTVPGSNAFNHVFLKVTKGEKVYWVDPTNMVSMAQGIFPDIADKPVLVLDSESSAYERTPNIDSNHAKTVIYKEIEFQDDTTLFSTTVNLIGEDSINLTGKKLTTSEEVIRDQLFYQFSGEHLTEEEKKEAVLSDLSSRIVRDLTFKLKFEQNNLLVKTNLGQALKIAAGYLNVITSFVPDQLSDIYIGPPSTIKIVRNLKNTKAENMEKLNFEKDSTWVYVSRIAKRNGENIDISDTTIIKKSFITSEELKSHEYLVLNSFLQKNSSEIAIILDK